MTSKVLPPAIDRPDIVVPDTSPLIHLALAGELRLLHEIGGTVVIVDVVAGEAIRDLDKPGAVDLARWIEAGRTPGSNAPVRVEETETGRLLAAARKSDPDMRAPNAGEAAIVEWLATTVQGTDRATIVLYENGRVPAIVANQGIDADIDVITTRAFLEAAERRGLITSAAVTWDRVAALAPTANPRIQTSQQRRTREMRDRGAPER